MCVYVCVCVCVKGGGLAIRFTFFKDESDSRVITAQSGSSVDLRRPGKEGLEQGRGREEDRNSAWHRQVLSKYWSNEQVSGTHLRGRLHRTCDCTEGRRRQG